jgi:hypothetical protein
MSTLLCIEKKIFIGIIFMFLVIIQTTLVEASSRPLVVCPKTNTPPQIDGQITDVCWQKATHIANFLSIKGDAFATEQSEVYTCYDQDNLYVAFKCYDSQMNKISAVKTVRDSDVWTDDCVDVFLDPDLSRRYFYQLIVNAIGTQQDINVTETSDIKWNIKWQSKTFKASDYWSVEIAIPFRQLGLKTPVAGDRWGANFNRESPRTPEYSGWVPTVQGFQTPTKFGDIVFTDSPGISFKIDSPGKDSAKVRLNVSSPDSAALLVEVNTSSAAGPKVATQQPIKLDEFGKTVEIPCSFVPCFVYNVIVKDSEGKKVLYQSPSFPMTGKFGVQVIQTP